MLKIKIYWEVDHGYAGFPEGSRVQEREVLVDKYKLNGDREEYLAFLETEVEYDFKQKITICIDDYWYFDENSYGIAYWEVDDGYGRGTRPQQTIIEINKDFYEEMTEDDLRRYVHGLVGEDFYNEIDYSIIGSEMSVVPDNE